jgi:hypothetical protein
MDSGFYAVDGHLDAVGSLSVARSLDAKLRTTPALTDCARPGLAIRS